MSRGKIFTIIPSTIGIVFRKERIFYGNVKKVSNAVSDTLLTGSTYDDTITNSGENVTIQARAGNDSIYNSDNEGNNSGSNVLIDGGTGNDIIKNGDEFSDGGDNVTILGGASSDEISNDGTNVLVNAGAGNDSIFNYYASFATVDAGNDNDYIYNNGKYSTLAGGTGNDIIENSTLSIWNPERQANEIFSPDHMTIDGGAGNDSISNAGANVLFKYEVGDGNDVIEGFNATSTLSIGGAKYTSAKSGNDLIFTVGAGKVTLQGAANLSTVNIIGDEEIVTLLTVTDTTKSPVTTDAAVKVVNASARTTAVKITGNASANTIISGAGNDTLTGGKGNDLFVYSGGKDVITDYAVGDKISLGAAISATAKSRCRVRRCSRP